MRIKEVFGYCSFKGCKNKYDFVVDIKAGNKKKKARICCDHAKELIDAASHGTVTVEQEIEF